MDNWQFILERFLRNECSERENKLVYYSLRDGLIDNEFCQSIDNFINNIETLTQIENMEPVSDEILENILIRIKKQKEELVNEQQPVRKRLIIPEWLKIAVAVVLTISLSWIVFHTKKITEVPATDMHVINVPTGQTVNITLADGTNIWLNSRTTMKYPSVFTGNRREVFLDGEGFFDVAHKPEQPFLVNTREYQIQALGTQLNVETYPYNGDFSVSLLEGSAKVTCIEDSTQTIILQTNTMTQLIEGRLEVKNITDFNYYRWREGLICFNDLPFTDLIEKFEICFGIKIIVQNDRVKNYKLTGKFRHTDGIDYALRVLESNSRFHFERDDENHVIYIK